MRIKAQPKKVKKYYCPVCGELLLKIYPWANISVSPVTKEACAKCLGNLLK